MNALVLVLLVSFAALLALHVAIIATLARKAPRRRALVALLVPPLVPFWAYRDRYYGRTLLWLGFFVTYVIARVLAAR